MLRLMTEKWFQLLEDCGWHVPAAEATWCTTAPDEALHSISVNGFPLKRSSRKEGFKVLGTKVTSDNTFQVELSERITKAWRSFYQHKDILLCKSGPIGSRLKFLNLVVQSTLFWCAGSWNLRKTQLASQAPSAGSDAEDVAFAAGQGRNYARLQHTKCPSIQTHIGAVRY